MFIKKNENVQHRKKIHSWVSSRDLCWENKIDKRKRSMERSTEKMMNNRGQIIQLLPPMGSLSKDHSDGIGSEKTNIWEMVTIF